MVPGPGRALSSSPSGTSVSPLPVRTGFPAGETVRIAYPARPGKWASAANTSTGPVTSRLWTPS